MKKNNAITLESPHGETLSIFGCCEDDCDCTSILLTKERRNKQRRMEITLPRHALESLRDAIDSILEFHDDKCLD